MLSVECWAFLQSLVTSTPTVAPSHRRTVARRTFLLAVLALTTATAADDLPTFKLDFGTTNSPVMPGFTRVTETDPMLSAPERLVSFARTTPDELAGDGVVAVRGGFKLTLPLPPGAYRVWVLSGDSVQGNYNAIKHLFQTVRIRAEGKRVFEQARDYWYAESFDYDPTADVWERYAGTNRFLEATFPVTVKGRSLDLAFDGLTGPRFDYAFPLNAVVVIPEANAAAMQADLASVRLERRRQWAELFPQLPLPEPDRPWQPDDADTARGYAVWWRDYLAKVYPNTVPGPGERLETPVAFATPGETESISFCLRPLVNLERVALELGDLVGPAGRVDRSQILPYRVRYNENVLRSGAWYAAEPWALIPWTNPDLPAHVTRQAWLKLQIPTNAAPGRYTGTVRITPQNAAPITLAYPFEVLPFQLERAPHASFFYFGSRRRLEYDAAGQKWFDHPAWWRFYELEASNLVAHGFVPFPELRIGSRGSYESDATPLIDGRTNLVWLDWSRAESRVAWLKKRNFLPPDGFWVVRCTYGTTYCGGGGRTAPYWNPDVNYSNLFCQITRAIDEKFRKEGWGIPVFEWGGELSNDGAAALESAIQAYSALKSCGAVTALRGNGWVDWSLYATNRLVDFPIPNIALLRDVNTTWITNHARALWLYNFTGARYGFGFFAWAKGATRRLHEGHLNDDGAPWDKFDGHHYQWERGAEATRDGVAPLLGFEWMAEGRDDYDYVYTLERRLAYARPGPAADAARQALAYVRSRCVTDIVYRGDPAEPASVEEAIHWRDLNAWRARIAQAIIALAE